MQSLEVLAHAKDEHILVALAPVSANTLKATCPVRQPVRHHADAGLVRWDVRTVQEYEGIIAL
jgi:hypothetical protein